MAEASSGNSRRIEDHTLSIAVNDDGSERVIALFGELDLASVGTFHKQLQEAFRGQSESVVIDLTGLDFIDSTGIAAIYRAAQQAEWDGTQLGLLRASGNVERTIAMMGLDKSLPFLD